MQHTSSFTEIFGELHFNESPIQSPSSSPHVSSSSFLDTNTTNHSKLIQNEETLSDHHNDIIRTPSSLPYISTRANSSESFASLSSESLQICTESLGSESSDEVEEDFNINEVKEEKHLGSQDFHGRGLWKSRSLREYPPPISCIGRSGKPEVSFHSYRNNGRLILKEIRIPKQDFLHAYREDGRLKLHFIQPAQEEEDDEEEYIYDEDYDGEESEEEGEENQDSVIDHVNEEKSD